MGKDTTPENEKVLTAAEIRERLLKDGDMNEALRLAELMQWKIEKELELNTPLPPEAFQPGAMTFAYSTEVNTDSGLPEGKYRPIDYGADKHLSKLSEMHQIVDLIFELKWQGAVASNSEHTHRTPTKALNRIIWNGEKTELGRVKNILSQYLQNCSAVEWGRHFVGKDGENMEDAVETANRNKSVQLTGEILALKNVFSEDGKSIDKK